MDVPVRCAFKSWKLRDNFELMDEIGKNIRVQCKLCLPAVNVLSTSKSSTSNLMKHLTRKHEDWLVKEEISREDISIKEEPEDYFPLPKKIPPINEPLCNTSLDQQVLDFILDTDPSLRLVDHPAFVKLIKGLSGGDRPMNQENLVCTMKNAFLNMKENVSFALVNANSLCGIIDMLHLRGQIYLCISASWINEGSLRRNTVGLAAMRKLPSPPSKQNVMALVNQVFIDYRIKDKVSFLLTDLESELCQIFPEFLVSSSLEENVKFMDAGKFICSGNESELQTCSYNRLNFIATTVMDSFRDNNSLYAIVRSKIAALWQQGSSCHSHIKALRDLMTTYVKPYVRKSSRWYTEFDIMSKLSVLKDEKLNEICNLLGVPKLLENELIFLREYVSTFQPLAQAIDVLKGTKRSYFGFILPTIITLKTKLTTKLPHAKHTVSFISSLCKSLDEHFSDLLRSQSAKMATSTLPKFRLCWVFSEEEKENIRREMHAEAKLLLSEVAQPALTYSESEDSDEDFFVLRNEVGSEGGSVQVNEVSRFLGDNPGSLSSLHSTPIVKELFLKYNSALPYCGSEERFLDHDGRPIPALRGEMPDEQMEMVILLRNNKDFYSL